MFDGFLTFAPQCSHCGADYSGADTGDGPAVFVMLLAGFLIVPFVLLLEIAAHPPGWVHALIWFPLTVGLCAALLRPVKGLLFALQNKHGAAEGRLDP